jgi:hypothetical protein
MAKKRFSAEQTVTLVRQIEAPLEMDATHLQHMAGSD